MQGYYSRRTTLHLQKYPSKNTSTALLITENRPHVQSHSESAQGEKLRYKLHKSTSFEIDQAHYLHKIFQRIEYSNDLRPLGILATGVNSQLIKMKIIMKKNMTNIACCIVSE